MMEILDKGLKVPKWVLIVRPKIPPKIPFVQLIFPISPKIQDIVEKDFIGHPLSVEEVNSAARRCSPLNTTICPIGPKIMDIVKKKASSGVHSPWGRAQPLNTTIWQCVSHSRKTISAEVRVPIPSQSREVGGQLSSNFALAFKEIDNKDPWVPGSNFNYGFLMFFLPNTGISRC